MAVLSACTKPPVHHLPPLTTFTPESRELFGCRINGKVFNPRAADSSLLGDCEYKPVYAGASGRVLRVHAIRHESECASVIISFTLDSVRLEEGATYFLGTKAAYKHHGAYSVMTGCSTSPVELLTRDGDYGIVTITKFDPDKKVVTGVFDFKVRDALGNVYRISDGVFDRHYSE